MMQTLLHIAGQAYEAHLDQPIDISIPLRFDASAPNCFYAPLPETFPVIAGDFIGSTAQGGLVNFLNVRLNPHGNGTHTECVGHIAKEPYSLNQCLRRFHFPARLVTVYPTRQDNGDRVIRRAQLAEALRPGEVEAVVIRTQPNDERKLSAQYSGTNPPYLHHAAAQLLVDYGVQHLLIDLPSVDREEDEGQLRAHRAYWQYPRQVRSDATITELIYVPNETKDGLYLLNLLITSFEIDVSPSKPLLYPLRAIQ